MGGKSSKAYGFVGNIDIIKAIDIQKDLLFLKEDLDSENTILKSLQDNPKNIATIARVKAKVEKIEKKIKNLDQFFEVLQYKPCSEIQVCVYLAGKWSKFYEERITELENKSGLPEEEKFDKDKLDTCLKMNELLKVLAQYNT